MNKKNDLNKRFNEAHKKSRKKIELFSFIVLSTILLLFLVIMFFGEDTAKERDVLSGRWKFKHLEKEETKLLAPTKTNGKQDLLLLKALTEPFIVLLMMSGFPIYIIIWLVFKCFKIFSSESSS